MNLLVIGLFSLIGFIYVYAIVDRICKAKEYAALTQAYGVYLSCSTPEQLKNVNFTKDLASGMPKKE